MAEVRLMIAAREYIVTCQDGEEQHLERLGAMVDAMARQAGGPAGGLNESRSLLFSALLLADKLHDSGIVAAAAGKAPLDPALAQVTKTLEEMAARLEIIADKLEQ